MFKNREKYQWILDNIPNWETKTQTMRNNVPSITTRTGGKQLQCYYHILMAMKYIPNPNNYEFVIHKDFDNTNNKIENLEWAPITNVRFRKTKTIHKRKKVEKWVIEYQGKIYKNLTDITRDHKLIYNQIKRKINSGEMKVIEHRIYDENNSQKI